MKRAFLVLGPEDTGTRLATKILLNAGCFGTDNHRQDFDNGDFRELDPIVWRRSVPHLGSWLDLQKLLTPLEEQGYDVNAVVTTRDWWVTAVAQVKSNHVKTVEEGLEHLERAYITIFDQLCQCSVSYCMLVYESLFLNPIKVQCALLQNLQLRIPRVFVPIRNENQKHWEAKS